MNDNILLWLWLKNALNDRVSKVCNTYAAFNDITAVYNAAENEYANIPNLTEEDVQALSNKDLRKATYILHLCESNHIGIVTIEDSTYPPLLRDIHNPPCVLFYFGNYEAAFSKPCITIVGSRKTNAYGEAITSIFSSTLVRGGFTVVCGVAQGIDTIAINSAAKANGSVIAVTPCGLIASNYITKFLFKNIQYNGVALSEYLPKSTTHKYSYHERNRILSGLSAGTIVTQANEKSGALLTASFALDQGRDVFSVPANIDDDKSIGSNNLIRDGAHVALHISDIFTFYQNTYSGIKYPDEFIDYSNYYPTARSTEGRKRMINFKEDMYDILSEREREIISMLDHNETAWNDIYLHSRLEADELNAVLSELEANGIIVSCPGNKYKIGL